MTTNTRSSSRSHSVESSTVSSTSSFSSRADTPAENNASLPSPCDIAVVGLAFEFPGASTTSAFWDLLVSGKCAATTFPSDRLSPERLNTGDATIRPSKASFIDRDIKAFDAQLFGMAEDEASATDPQLRILLETAYRALEDAGITLKEISGTDASVYTGCFTADYAMAAAKDPERVPRYSATGMAQSMLSNRLSSFFNLSGPSVTVDTACSSSLVALDMACRSISTGESSMSIVAGCNLLLTPDLFISLSNLGFLSPDGVSHSFDQRANGYGRGEGFGVLVVKPVSAAIRDGDTIRAVIRATGTNQNGRTNLALPSKEMQRRLIEETYHKAGIDMAQTRYFESHGTGTAVGDPLEALAIGGAFSSRQGAERDSVIVGALKANIGHLEGAAGIAGVIKTILVLENGIIPPIAGLQILNPDIDAKFLKLQFPTTVISWPCAGLRRASVNSFGFGGTNAHAIVDDALHYLESRGLSGRHRTRRFAGEVTGGSTSIAADMSDLSLAPIPRIISWSAHDSSTVSKLVEEFRAWLQHTSWTKDAFEELAYQLTERRHLHEWRTFVVAACASELAQEVQSSKTPQRASQADYGPSLGFVFTGQGAQWLGMGKDLMASPVFRESVMGAENYLGSIGCDWKASSLIDHTLDSNTEPKTNIDDPRYAQPLCTILQVALVDLLGSFGITPAAVVGHSSGEIAAAYAAGAISQRAAWKLAYYRGLLSSILASAQSHCRGSMMAVGLSDVAARQHIDELLVTRNGQSKSGILTIACINSPSSVTISGDEDLVRQLQELLNQRNIFARILRVPVAYHSPHMSAIASCYKDLIGTIEPGAKPPSYVSMISSVAGDWIDTRELTKAEYWVNNMVSPVQFLHAIKHICGSSSDRKAKRTKLDLSHRKFPWVSHLVELGPHSALQQPIAQILENARSSIQYMSAITRGKAATKSLLEVVGTLHCLGLDSINLAKVNRLEHRDQPPLKLKTLSNEPIMVTLPPLPQYPFNHSQIHWSESSLSKNLRLAPQPYNPFLGSPAADWNPLDARWRNRLALATMPWLADHRINGEILFPAAGMWVMAVEAMTQLIRGSSTDGTAEVEIVGYELRDTRMLNALVIPDQDGDSAAEVDFRLRSILDRGAANKGSSAWAEFSLYTRRNTNDLEQQSFVEICQGSIKAIFKGTEPHEGLREGGQQDHDIRNMISSASSLYAREVDHERVYERLAECGYQYGPTFQGIQTARLDGEGHAVGRVTICNEVPSSFGNKSPVAIHPCDLDSILQLCLPIVQAGTPRETWVPTYMTKLFIPAQGFISTRLVEVDVHATTEQSGRRLCQSAVQAMVSDTSSDAMVLQIEGAELTMITDVTKGFNTEAEQREERRLCYDITYTPDITSLSPQQLKDYLHDTASATQPDPSDFLSLLRSYTASCMSLAVATVPRDSIPQDKPHLAQLHSWINHNIPSSHTSPEELFSFTTSLSSTRLGEVHVNFGAQLPSIFRGEIDPLSILLENDTLREYYVHFNSLVKYYAPLTKYLTALAHKNPAIRILEVGAGTGSTTEHVLGALVTENTAEDSVPFRQFGRYDFTDISPLFLDRARETTVGKMGGEKMRYCVFDVEGDDVEGQGLEEGGYDLVIAANVLHATPSLERSLGNLHKLLADGGKLILVEVTNPLSTIGPFMFGCLEGWWRAAEPWRQNGPVATPTDWDQELRSTGFQMETILHDFKDEENQFSSIIIANKVSLAVKGAILSSSKPALLVTGWEEVPTFATSQHSTLSIVKACLGEQGIATTCCTFSRAVSRLHSKMTAEQPLVIVLQDSSTWPSFAHMSPEQYAAFHHTLSAANNIMWIGANTPFSIGPVLGLARGLRKERHGLVFSTVALEPSSTPEALSACILQATKNFLQGVWTGICPEWELTQIGSSLHIPRVYENAPLNGLIRDFVACKANNDLAATGPNKKLKIRQPGLLDTLHFESLPITATASPGVQEIEIDIRSIGLNFRDCLVALGRVDQDDLGSECSGIVTAIGNNVTRFQVGNRVTACLMDCFRIGKMTCPENLACPIPDNMTFSHAAAIPINFVTAYHSLIRTARLSPGETILIHSGAGGTGQAAIQIAKWVGATVFVTVGSREKRDMLVGQYGIPSERVLYSRDLSFAADVKRLTAGKGVDVVLNSLAGDALVASWECVAPYGRFIEIGKRDIFSHGKLPMYQFAKNVSFCAVDLRAISVDRPEVIKEELAEVVGLFERGVLKLPQPVKVFGTGEVEDAFRYLQSGKNAGKVVVDVGDGDGELTGTPPGGWQFEADGTYVIAGGLGAMGRSIAGWMVMKGVRHLVLLSRSGATSAEALAFVESLQSQGADVYSPPCDAADRESLRAVLHHCKAHMPPIKGCIQAAMVLRDGFFEDMDHKSWSDPLKPKIDASWNLHEQLPDNLDFFIFFSSVAAIIGSQAQANYAAGNTFQDELARYRVSKGLRALSVNLSLVGGPVGFSAEHPELAQQFILTKHILDMSTDEMLGLLEFYCNPENAASSKTSQVVMGLDLPHRVAERGMDLPAWMHESTFANLHQITGSAQASSSDSPTKGSKSSGSDNLRARAEQAESVGEAATVLSGALVTKLCKVLGRGPSDIDPTQPLYVYGVDSLVAVELRNWLRETLKVDVAVFEILGGSSCSTIAQDVARKIWE
ncbi:lovastatin diketide synthase LovF [Cercophora samala]|uniref:Lovastatin diketide synthase LovF n=1 Tax=Cercophora samala TaxID=330535 RepID=A0AA39ZAI6_9PEZI|nr:lovastatin diketide synthase LovF [Cercophora samala]